MTTHNCPPGEGFSSSSSTNVHGSTTNDGTCGACAVGQYSDASDASGCISMNLSPCLGGGGGGGGSGNSQGEEYESTTARSDLTGATANDGTCVGCTTKGPHWYKAESGFDKCYLYTCAVGGNRCASGAFFIFLFLFFSGNKNWKDKLANYFDFGFLVFLL